MNAKCDLCNEIAKIGTVRLGGRELCDACNMGDLPSRMRRVWGWNIDIHEKQYQYKDTVLYVTHFEVWFKPTGQLDLLCKRKKLRHKLFGFLMPNKVKSGDPLFDNFAILQSKTPAQLSPILKQEGFQSIVMDLLGDTSKVTVKTRRLTLSRRVLDEYDPPQRLFVEVAILASYLDHRFSDKAE